jgi:predicted enzyme related to lactoylglutathione lyase
MPKVVHFEIPANDPERSSKFYTDVFGWQITNWGGAQPYWIINAGTEEEPGINGGMMKKQDGNHPVTIVIGVHDVDAFLPAIESAGGTVVVPKMAIPGVGYVAYFKDLDDNIVGVYHNDPTAA